jgi:thiamine-phosphate pyrophosphorylase
MALLLSALYPILDSHYLPAAAEARAAFLETAWRELEDAGVTLVQLREKDTARDQIHEDARTLLRSASGAMRLLLNDDAALAKQTGSAGVHLGQKDMAAGQARLLLGAQAILGVSTHTAAQVEAADRLPVDYIAIGPVFATSTKPDAEPVVGLEGVRAARALTRKPLVAIGGITLNNAANVREAGADSVAVISALFGDPTRSPGKLAEDFLRRLR